MSEIEKAREALVEKLMIEGGGTRSEAEDVVAYFAQFIEASARAIAREEIEAALNKSPATPSLTGDQELDMRLRASIRWFNSLPAEQQEEHLRRQRESWVRGEMGLGLDNNRATINQEGGDPHSTGRCDPAEDKSPPAVEAPAAGDKGSSGALLAASHRDGYEAGKADTSALARRLAERMEWGLAVLKNVVAVDDVVGQSVIRLTEDVLTEARKRGLIE